MPPRTYWTSGGYAQGCLLNHTTSTSPPVNAKYGDEMCNRQTKGTTVSFNTDFMDPSMNAIMPAHDDFTGNTNNSNITYN